MRARRRDANEDARRSADTGRGRGLRRQNVVGANGRRATAAANAGSLEADSAKEDDPDVNAADAASSVASSRSKWNLGQSYADAEARRV